MNKVVFPDKWATEKSDNFSQKRSQVSGEVRIQNEAIRL